MHKVLRIVNQSVKNEFDVCLAKNAVCCLFHIFNYNRFSYENNDWFLFKKNMNTYYKWPSSGFSSAFILNSCSTCQIVKFDKYVKLFFETFIKNITKSDGYYNSKIKLELNNKVISIQAPNGFSFCSPQPFDLEKFRLEVMTFIDKIAALTAEQTHTEIFSSFIAEYKNLVNELIDDHTLINYKYKNKLKFNYQFFKSLYNFDLDVKTGESMNFIRVVKSWKKFLSAIEAEKTNDLTLKLFKVSEKGLCKQTYTWKSKYEFIVGLNKKLIPLIYIQYGPKGSIETSYIVNQDYRNKRLKSNQKTVDSNCEYYIAVPRRGENKIFCPENAENLYEKITILFPNKEEERKAEYQKILVENSSRRSQTLRDNKDKRKYAKILNTAKESKISLEESLNSIQSKVTLDFTNKVNIEIIKSYIEIIEIYNDLCKAIDELERNLFPKYFHYNCSLVSSSISRIFTKIENL